MAAPPPTVGELKGTAEWSLGVFVQEKKKNLIPPKIGYVKHCVTGIALDSGLIEDSLHGCRVGCSFSRRIGCSYLHARAHVKVEFLICCVSN